MAHRLLTHPATAGAPADAGVAAALLAYLRLLAGSQPDGRFLEIRAINAGRVQRGFVAAARPRLAAARIRELAGALRRLPRRRVAHHQPFRWQAGDRRLPPRLHRMRHPRSGPTRSSTSSIQPTMVIASGTPGHLHIYWQLRHPYANEQIERANRQLAHHLAGDPASVDIARVLRPPAHAQPQTPARHARRTASRTAPLPATPSPNSPPGSPTPSPRTPAGRALVAHRSATPLDARLRAIPAAEYVHALTGRTPDRTGKIHCPFHPDDTTQPAALPGRHVLLFWLPGRRQHLRLRRRTLVIRPPRWTRGFAATSSRTSVNASPRSSTWRRDRDRPHAARPQRLWVGPPSSQAHHGCANGRACPPTTAPPDRHAPARATPPRPHPRRALRADPQPPSAKTNTTAARPSSSKTRAERQRWFWQLSAADRVASMRRGELSLQQCCAWAARAPHEVPLLDGSSSSSPPASPTSTPD